MYDIHCHIMPDVDDGSSSADDSLEMLKNAARGGTLGIICTPHCNVPDLYDNYFSLQFKEKIAELKALAEKHEIKVEIYPGQEVFLAGPVPRLLDEGKLTTLNGSDYMLCEFEPGEPGERLCAKLEFMQSRGYIPIVAHPERYAFAINDESAARRMKDTGALLQIDKDSILGRFGGRIADTAHRMLEERIADFIGSDAHSPYFRTPDLSEVHEAVSELYSFGYANHLLCDNPKKVIDNKRIYSYR